MHKYAFLENSLVFFTLEMTPFLEHSGQCLGLSEPNIGLGQVAAIALEILKHYLFYRAESNHLKCASEAMVVVHMLSSVS